jgi:hypothetical protein
VVGVVDPGDERLVPHVAVARVGPPIAQVAVADEVAEQVGGFGDLPGE